MLVLDTLLFIAWIVCGIYYVIKELYQEELELTDTIVITFIILVTAPFLIISDLVTYLVEIFLDRD